MVQIKIVGNGYFQVLSFGSKAQYIVVYGTAILSDFLFLTVHRLSSLLKLSYSIAVQYRVYLFLLLK